MNSDSRVILISGGTKGIGKGALLKLLQYGFYLATFSRHKDNILKLKSEIKALNIDKSKVLIINADITHEKSVKKVVNKTIEKFHKIDILINNAGYGYFALSDKVDINKFSNLLKVNVLGQAILTKYVVPHMKKLSRGLIINIVSRSGKRSFPMGEFYSASKYALMGYSEGIRAELNSYGIKVSTICPGMVNTDFFTREELARREKRNGVAPKLLAIEDISSIIGFICQQSENCNIEDLTVVPF